MKEQLACNVYCLTDPKEIVFKFVFSFINILTGLLIKVATKKTTTAKKTTTKKTAEKKTTEKKAPAKKAATKKTTAKKVEKKEEK